MPDIRKQPSCPRCGDPFDGGVCKCGYSVWNDPAGLGSALSLSTYDFAPIQKHGGYSASVDSHIVTFSPNKEDYIKCVVNDLMTRVGKELVIQLLEQPHERELSVKLIDNVRVDHATGTIALELAYQIRADRFRVPCIGGNKKPKNILQSLRDSLASLLGKPYVPSGMSPLVQTPTDTISLEKAKKALEALKVELGEQTPKRIKIRTVRSKIPYENQNTEEGKVPDAPSSVQANEGTGIQTEQSNLPASPAAETERPPSGV